MKISAVVLTKNEEKNIADCLDCLSFCDEIIVVDDGSEDRTTEIAEKMGAKVFTRFLDNDFSKQRNFGLEKANNEWTIFIDADERITTSLKSAIENAIYSDQYDGFLIKRQDVVFGKRLEYGETGNISFVRLARKNAGKWAGEIHEVWKIKGKIGILRTPLIHYPHQTIKEFLSEINFYTDIKSLQLYNMGIKVHFWSIIIYPKAKFLLNYFMKRGFLDGTAGLVFALMMSLHSFLVRAKLWILWQKK